MSALANYLTKQVAAKQAAKQQCAATSTGDGQTDQKRVDEDPIFVKDELNNIVDSWLSASPAFAKAPERSVDVFDAATDSRAGLGATFGRRHAAPNIEGAAATQTAMDNAINRIRKQAAREQDDMAEDHRFDAQVHKERKKPRVTDDSDSSVEEVGRSDLIRPKCAPTVALLHHKLSGHKRKKNKKKTQSDSGRRK